MYRTVTLGTFAKIRENTPYDQALRLMHDCMVGKNNITGKQARDQLASPSPQPKDKAEASSFFILRQSYPLALFQFFTFFFNRFPFFHILLKEC